ncbi:MAG: hypothetical protein Q8L55_05145 [Phycisphaerales bacterium]|nr:hypothetical protein [Phycisphaerales bacterium]
MSKGKFDVKSVMAWVQRRWSLVAFVVIAALLVPAMVYFAMGMMASKHNEFQAQVSKDSSDFNTTAITYKVPSLLPGESGVEWTYAPNEVVTSRFKEALDRQQASAAGVVAEAVKYNKGDRAPLVAGVFPNPPANDLAKAKQFWRVLVSDGQNTLLSMINAKPPIANDYLAQRLNEHRNNFLQREQGTDATPNGIDRLSEEKRKALEDGMVAERVSAYVQWGQKLNVYATTAIFNLPPVVEANTPSPLELWDWQVQYWTMQDVMRAVADANASAKDVGVTKSVVKRIDRLTVDPVLPAPQQGGAFVDPAAPAAPADGAHDYAVSITGRKSSALYDVVTANLVCVVATKDLPSFFDAVSRANMMTVTSVNLSKIDPAAELREGYYYGPDGVTRVEMKIEALWLREWTHELMPKEVKVALGLEAPDPSAPGPEGGVPGGTPAPAGPAPSGRRAGSVGG